MNPQLTYGRTLMGDSLGFHILFALLGLGLPFVISLAELIGILKKDSDYYNAAQRWSFAMATLFVVGAVSGTIISLQLNTLWPSFMVLAGKVIGLPFFLEGFAFFIEAIFLGVYLFTWERFGRWTHWLCSLPLVLGSAASAFFITTANAWMNNPAGFELRGGAAININPVKAMFNPATPTETSHSIAAYYLTTTLAFAGLYALFLWREKFDAYKQKYFKKIIVLMMALSLLFAVVVALTGDSSGKYLAKYEPLKLAAAEDLQIGGRNAALPVGGLTVGGQLEHALRIPEMLSWLATGSFNGYVKGLYDFSPSLWPPLWIHYMFDSMVFIGIFVTFVPLLFLLLYLHKRKWAFSKLLLLGIIICGFLGFLAVEFGWILTEVGRQPYVIAGIMTTAQAFTTNPGVAQWGYIFPSLYGVLFVITPWILRRHYKKYPLKLENPGNIKDL